LIQLSEATALARRICDNVELALHGKTESIERAVETLLAGGHLLLEDVPGVGKTTLANALSRSIDGAFQRIQFTSDLLPSDILGASMPDFQNGQPTGGFRFQPGPIFASVVLADEINRANPKTQSALLEAMSEGSVTIDGVTHALPDPFFVIATQNPSDQYGTHPLPESQLDRFMTRIQIGYPDLSSELAVLRDDPFRTQLPGLEAVAHLDDLRDMQACVQKVKIPDSILNYLLTIVEHTRQHPTISLGVSTRGALALRHAAQAHALMDGRDYCVPDDVRDIASDVFAHRIITNNGGGLTRGPEEAMWVLREILDQVPIPL